VLKGIPEGGVGGKWAGESKKEDEWVRIGEKTSVQEKGISWGIAEGGGGRRGQNFRKSGMRRERRFRASSQRCILMGGGGFRAAALGAHPSIEQRTLKK